jgi:RNase P subunit RPR2
MSEVTINQTISNTTNTVLVEQKIKRQRYQANRRAPLGTVIECANCGRVIRKKQSNTQFCSTRGDKSCENQYWSDDAY